MKKIITGVLIILALAGLFYWYELKPQQIRRECSSYVQDMINNLKKTVGDPSKKFTDSNVTAFVDLERLEYSNCLHLKGLKE